MVKVEGPDGNVEILAVEELVSTTKNISRASADNSWIYIQTDRYATHINYEVLLPLLEQAVAWTTISAQLGITITVLAYINAYSPAYYYREDISYYYVTDPLYYKIKSNFYKYSSYTQLIDTITKYWHA